MAINLIPDGNLRISEAFTRLRNSSHALDHDTDTGDLLRALIHDDLVARVETPAGVRNLPSEGWDDLTAHWVLTRGTIAADSPWSECAGLTPFVDAAAFGAWLARLGRIRETVFKRYDPFRAHWLDAATAAIWIETRNKRLTMLCTPKYREDVMRADAPESISHLSFLPSGMIASQKDIVRELRDKISGGEVQARAVLRDTGAAVPIKPVEAANLDLTTDRDFTDIWHMGGNQYRGLELYRADVLKAWPHDDGHPTAHAVHFDREKTRYSLFEAVMWAACRADTNTHFMAADDRMQHGQAELIKALADHPELTAIGLDMSAPANGRGRVRRAIPADVWKTIAPEDGDESPEWVASDKYGRMNFRRGGAESELFLPGGWDRAAWCDIWIDRAALFDALPPVDAGDGSPPPTPQKPKSENFNTSQHRKRGRKPGEGARPEYGAFKMEASQIMHEKLAYIRDNPNGSDEAARVSLARNTVLNKVVSGMEKALGPGKAKYRAALDRHLKKEGL